jgi:hypothetical protein
LIRESNLRFKQDEFVFGFLETVVDFFFVGIFETDFIGAEMGEDFDGLPLRPGRRRPFSGSTAPNAR